MKKLPLIILIFAGITFQIQAFNESPKISFREIKYDFGKVEEGAELTHVFKFKNTGAGVLEIQSVNPSCGCTGVEMGDKKTYKHNESGKIKVSFNTRGREGKQTKSVTVKTNDPNEPQVVLVFTCEIISKQ